MLVNPPTDTDSDIPRYVGTPLNLCYQDIDPHPTLKMAPRVLFFGAGSIGGVYLYLLSRAVPASNITIICYSNYKAVVKNRFIVNSSL